MGVSRVLVRLLQISYKQNMAFTAFFTVKYNVSVGPGWGIRQLFYAPPWGFWMNRPAPLCGICSFSDKKK